MPRERLLKYGVKALADYELLAILLRTGSKNKDVLSLSQDLLKKMTLIDLKNISVEELMQHLGIKLAKATTIIAALELGTRLYSLENEVEVISSPKDVYNLVGPKLKFHKQEHFMIIYLNNKGGVIKEELKYIGTSSQLILQPKEIYSEAIKLHCYAIVIVHNHPSGDSTPSRADILTTRKLIEVGNLVGIDLLDHIIIGKGEYYSIKEERKYIAK